MIFLYNLSHNVNKYGGCMERAKLLIASILIVCAFILNADKIDELGKPTATNQKYVNWLEKQSMLYDAVKINAGFTGNKSEWQHEFSFPITEKILKKQPVMYTAYPDSTLTEKGQNFTQYYSSPEVWKIFKEIGINILHTCPVKKSGGIDGYKHTPTIDGYFDRIALEVSPNFGTNEEYKKMTQVATQYGGIVLGDTVPGHTGKGADFDLATMYYKNYQGLYDLVEIDKDDWEILPTVKDSDGAVLLTGDQVNQLKEKGYIPGPCLKCFEEAGWSATSEITGVDGKNRRMVYFHAFKPGQPALNWTSPTMAPFQLICGDILQSLEVLGAGALRLDATPFCGIAVAPKIRENFGNPISVLVTKFLSMTIRKFGGWSYQELCVPFDQLDVYSGSDFYYDFFARPAVEHAALTGDASFLYICNQLMRKNGIKQKILIHDTQNHDEITYGLPQLDALKEKVEYHGKMITGPELKKIIIKEKDKLAINSYNKGFGGGVASTMAGYLAAGLGIKNIDNLSSKQIETIKKLHLLIVVYNAMQPGIFGISGWDMVGALPIPDKGIENLLADNDNRWHNRGSYDLTGSVTGVDKSVTGLPKCKTIYGPVPEQLKNPNSFCSQLKKIIAARNKYNIQLADQIDVPNLRNKSVFISIQKLPDKGGLEITALNFGKEEAGGKISLVDLPEIDVTKLNGKTFVNILTDENDSAIINSEINISLKPMSAKALLIK